MNSSLNDDCSFVAHSRKRRTHRHTQQCKCRKLYWYLDIRSTEPAISDYGCWNQFFKSGFLLYLFKYYLAFLLLSFFWVAVFRLVYDPTELVQYYYSHTGVALLTVVIGYIYYNWAGECTARFERRATAYIELVESVYNMATTISWILPSHENLKKDFVTHRASENTVHMDMEERMTVEELIHDIRILLCGMVVSINYIFICDGRRLHSPAKKCLRDIPLTEQLYHEMVKISPPVASELHQRHSCSSDCSRSRDHQNYTKLILNVIQRRLNQLRNAKHIESADITSVHDSVRDFRKIFDPAMAFVDVYMYRMYQSYFFAVMSFYFTLLPLILWSSWNTMIIIVYPPTILIIGGLFIIMRWLGDPFEGDSVYNRLDHNHKKDEACREIYHLFMRYCPAPENIWNSSNGYGIHL